MNVFLSFSIFWSLTCVESPSSRPKSDQRWTVQCPEYMVYVEPLRCFVDSSTSPETLRAKFTETDATAHLLVMVDFFLFPRECCEKKTRGGCSSRKVER
jgi:hypothetical protein